MEVEPVFLVPAWIKILFLVLLNWWPLDLVDDVRTLVFFGNRIAKRLCDLVYSLGVHELDPLFWTLPVNGFIMQQP